MHADFTDKTKKPAYICETPALHPQRGAWRATPADQGYDLQVSASQNARSKTPLPNSNEVWCYQRRSAVLLWICQFVVCNLHLSKGGLLRDLSVRVQPAAQ